MNRNVNRGSLSSNFITSFSSKPSIKTFTMVSKVALNFHWTGHRCPLNSSPPLMSPPIPTEPRTHHLLLNRHNHQAHHNHIHRICINYHCWAFLCDVTCKLPISIQLLYVLAKQLKESRKWERIVPGYFHLIISEFCHVESGRRGGALYRVGGLGIKRAGVGGVLWLINWRHHLY